MASTARIDELKKKFDENPRRYFAPLANEFRKAGDIEQAIVICEEFLPQQPGHMSGHIVYGQALFEAGKLPEARTVFETALGLDPENLIALRHLGDIARGQADYPAARGWYVRVLDADPRNEEIQGLIGAIDAETASTRPSDFEPEPVADLVPAASAFHLDLADTHSFEAPVVPPPIPFLVPDTTPTVAMPAVRPAAEISAGFAMHGIEPAPDTSSLMPDPSTRAEGLEPAEFTAPGESIATSSDLDATHDSGVPSFEPPAEQVATLSGLQGSGGIGHEEINAAHAETAIVSAFPPLDIEGGLLVPSHSSPTPAVPAAAIPEGDAHEFNVPVAVAEDVGAAVDDEIPFELPPEVIAAEAELTTPPTPESDEDAVPAGHAPFATETMAELYAAQGFRDQASAVYSQLLAADPANERFQARVADLTPTEAVADPGPNVRDFFARIAMRRPGVRSAATAPPSDDDFAMPTSKTPPVGDVIVAATEPVVEDVLHAPELHDEPVAARVEDPAPVEMHPEEAVGAVAPAIERAASLQTPSGSIDALFGNRLPGSTEDSAAAALAQAFGGSSEEMPEISGHPARAATGELSLDSVFRDGPARPPRPSQSFYFDQFFSEGASTGNVSRSSGSQQTQRASEDVANPTEPPAERSADDIEQFNSWLQGLKQR